MYDEKKSVFHTSLQALQDRGLAGYNRDTTHLVHLATIAESITGRAIIYTEYITVFVIALVIFGALTKTVTILIKLPI